MRIYAWRVIFCWGIIPINFYYSMLMSHNCVTLKVNTIWCIFIRIHTELDAFSLSFFFRSSSFSFYTVALTTAFIRNNAMDIWTWALFWHPKYLALYSRRWFCWEMLTIFSSSSSCCFGYLLLWLTLLSLSLWLAKRIYPMDVFGISFSSHKRQSANDKRFRLLCSFFVLESGGRYYKRNHVTFFSVQQPILGCHENISIQKPQRVR